MKLLLMTEIVVLEEAVVLAAEENPQMTSGFQKPSSVDL